MPLEENYKRTQGLYPWARRYDVGDHPLQKLINKYNTNEFRCNDWRIFPGSKAVSDRHKTLNYEKCI